MRVFRQQYKDRKGQTKESAKWYVELKDHNDAFKRIPGFTDKSATIELGRKLSKLVSARVAHDPPTAELVRWIEGLPTSLKNKLVDLGMVDGQSSVSGKRLSDHLQDFKQNLKDRGRTPAYCQLVTTRIQTILDDCGFRQLNDIAGDKLESFLAKLQTKKGRSQQTANFYLVALKNFLNWMVKNRRLSTNPLAHVQGGNVEVDRRLERREISEEEIRWLLATVQSGKTIRGLTGWQRFTLYSMALGTGLRASELASLTPQSLDLESDPPIVRILAKNEKARRGDTLPLPPDLAEVLRSWLSSVEPDAKLWPGPWAKYKWASKFVQHDLKTGREAWLKAAPNDAERKEMEKTDFLSYRDANGQQADFHALRHTYLSRLGRSGASAKVMQRLARHSTVELTLGRYTHAGLFDLKSAVGKLPALPTASAPREPESIRATGTNAADVLPAGLPKRPAHCRRSVRSSAQTGEKADVTSNEETAEKNRDFSTVSSGEAGIRTLDPLAGMPVFKTGAIGRSATSPFSILDDSRCHFELLSVGLGDLSNGTFVPWSNFLMSYGGESSEFSSRVNQCREEDIASAISVRSDTSIDDSRDAFENHEPWITCRLGASSFFGRSLVFSR